MFSRYDIYLFIFGDLKKLFGVFLPQVSVQKVCVTDEAATSRSATLFSCSLGLFLIHEIFNIHWE